MGKKWKMTKNQEYKEEAKEEQPKRDHLNKKEKQKQKNMDNHRKSGES